MFIYILILLAAATRLVPHLDNAAAITAVAIFSGAFLPKKQAFVVPLLARLITDLVLGFFAWQLMIAVYASHLAGVLLGMWVKSSEKTSARWAKIIGSSLAASVLFFLVTNFAFLYSSYPHNVSGIIMAYANGLPFFRGTLVGDVSYAVGLFLLKDAADLFSLRLRKAATQGMQP